MIDHRVLVAGKGESGPAARLAWADPLLLTAILLLLGASVERGRLHAADWPMLGRSPERNSVVPAGNAPIEWNIKSGKNIRWSAKLGSMTHGSPIVAGGQVYVGTNNGAAYLQRYPSTVDLGCLLCFRESDGKFLWQLSVEKHPGGRVHDWPLQGMGCHPLVEDQRMWIVSNRWEVICLDTQGFLDGENDGPWGDEPVTGESEADVVWKLDLIDRLGVHPHSAGMGPDRRCAIAAWGDRIFVVTGNGVDVSHFRLPTPDAPSLVCLDKHTGEVLWTDNSPGQNVLHTQVASPLVAEIAGRVQVVVPQGDGWLRSFQADTGELIWKFDINRKTSQWILGGQGTRNNILATPVLYENRIYIASGQEAEHGDGEGRLVCIDPTKTGDISSELAVDRQGRILPHRRIQAVDPEQGERAIANPNSGLVWEFVSSGNDFEDEMHRTFASVAVHRGLVIAQDFSGLVHCLDANTGRRHWSYDLFAQSWSTPLVVGENVYVADEDGEVAVFRLSADPQVAMKPDGAGFARVDGRSLDLAPINEITLDASIYTSPVFANGTLYLATKNTLFAIAISPGAGPEADAGAKLQETSTPTAAGAKQPSTTPKQRIAKAAYVPTPNDVVQSMLALADVQADDVVCDLGSGDGRIPIAAAKHFGAQGIGYEIDRELVARSRRNAEAEGVVERVRFYDVDLFEADLSAVDVVTLYLFPVQNRELLPRLKNLKRGARIVTHRYALPGIEPEAIVNIRSQDSGEMHTLYRYSVPLSINCHLDVHP